ncbi:MAG: hypothetical protein HYV63_10365 [Candidatus Schekmanbacteria bacterium]|nr:hypothetical protein [Candidatus Schekmanbacteria bacterium]
MQSDLRRPLGPNEEVFHHLDALSSPNFAIVATVLGPLEDDAIVGALAHLQRRHPILRATIHAPRWRAPRFAPASTPIPYRRCDAAVRDAHRMVDNALQSCFLPGTPRLGVHRFAHGAACSTIALVLHHAIADAKSGIFLLADLLRVLRAMAEGAAPDTASLQPLPYFEELFPREYRGWRAVARYASALPQVARIIGGNGYPVPLPAGPPAAFDPALRRLFSVRRVLEPDHTRHLVGRSRRAGTTVQGALQAALIRAVAGELPAAPGLPVGYGAAVDLRRALAPPVGADCGLFVTGVGGVLRVRRDDAFWSLARAVRADLDRAFERRWQFFIAQVPHRWAAPLGRWLGARGARTFGRFLHRSQWPMVLLTNIGQVTTPLAHGPFRVTELGFAVNPSAFRDLVATAATLDGRLALTVCGVAPRVLPDAVSRIADHTVATLLRELAPAED